MVLFKVILLFDYLVSASLKLSDIAVQEAKKEVAEIRRRKKKKQQ